MRRAAASHAVVVVAALVLGAGVAGAALVGFSAEVQNRSTTFAGGWLTAPTSLQTPVVSGNGATLTWTPSTHALTGQAVVETDEGTTNSCSGATYATPVTTGLAAAATTYTDAGSGTASGHWICYQVQSTRDSWTKAANFSVVRVGLVPTGIAIASGSSSGQISDSDTIQLTFNQNVTYTGSTPISVCAFVSPANTILIGDTGCAHATDVPTIGTITGVSIPNGSRTYPSSTVTVSGSTVTIALGGAPTNAQGRTAVTGTGTFTYAPIVAPATSTLVVSASGSANVCTASNCTWTYSGSF